MNVVLDQTKGGNTQNGDIDIKHIGAYIEDKLTTKMSAKEAFLLRPPNNVITLIKSPFNKRPPTIFFPYPGYLKMQRPVEGGAS